MGLTVEVVFDTFGQEKFTGLIVRIPVRVDAKRRVLPIVVEVANPQNRIKAGVSAYVRIKVPTETIVAPSLGVTRLDTRASVVVVEGWRARFRGVRLGAELGGGVVAVLEGLVEGEEIVIYGQQFLEEGDPVDRDWRRWARRD